MTPTKRECGRLGGQALVVKYGHLHMSAIGARGAKSLWNKYKLQPCGTAGWALVDRITNKVVSYNNYNLPRRS